MNEIVYVVYIMNTRWRRRQVMVMVVTSQMRNQQIFLKNPLIDGLFARCVYMHN